MADAEQLCLALSMHGSAGYEQCHIVIVHACRGLCIECTELVVAARLLADGLTPGDGMQGMNGEPAGSHGVCMCVI